MEVLVLLLQGCSICVRNGQLLAPPLHSVLLRKSIISNLIQILSLFLIKHAQRVLWQSYYIQHAFLESMIINNHQTWVQTMHIYIYTSLSDCYDWTTRQLDDWLIDMTCTEHQRSVHYHSHHPWPTNFLRFLSQASWSRSAQLQNGWDSPYWP